MYVSPLSLCSVGVFTVFCLVTACSGAFPDEALWIVGVPTLCLSLTSEVFQVLRLAKVFRAIDSIGSLGFACSLENQNRLHAKNLCLKGLLVGVYILIIISKVVSVNRRKHNIYNDYGEKNSGAVAEYLLNRKDERTLGKDIPWNALGASMRGYRTKDA